MVRLSHFRIIKEPEESLCTYILHSAEIDIIANAGISVFAAACPLFIHAYLVTKLCIGNRAFSCLLKIL